MNRARLIERMHAICDDEPLAHCGVCQWYHPADEGGDHAQGHGQCRRLSPNEGWATVAAAEWCGRFKPSRFWTERLGRQSWRIEAH